MNRTIVIGDIHGCYDELCELLEKIELTPQDRVIAVGDLTVKGPKNCEVLQLFSRDKRFASVIGNHDYALVSYWKGKTAKIKPSQQRAFDEIMNEEESLLDYLGALPTFMELDANIVVHAGLRPGISLKQQSIEDLLELRTLGADRTSREGTPWYEVYEGKKTVLFGHWPTSPPRRGKAAIGLDTGCVYGYQLTAYIIETDEFFSVQSHATYDQSVTPKSS